MLSYVSPPPAAVLQPKLVVLQFSDQRGTEGDHGDRYRVGGVYGGYGNRLAKVILNEPWPPRLLATLVAEFRAAGVDAVGLQPLSTSRPLDVPWLEGEVRNFSTEARWGREAHVSAIVRLRAPGGGTLVQKEIQGNGSGYNFFNNFDEDLLQKMLNEAFTEFVQRVARDPEIRAALAASATTPLQTPSAVHDPPPPLASPPVSTSVPVSPSGAKEAELTEKLRLIQDLRDQHLISPEEADQRRRELLDRALR